MSVLPLEQSSLVTRKIFPRLSYLDGLRGLAALFVVIHHAFAEIAPDGSNSQLPSWCARFLSFLWDGELAVIVFIVLSGYCLMLPVARRGHLGGGGTLDFFRRRARRILPPYYLAIAFCLALDFLVPGLARWRGVRWDLTLPATSPGALLSHLLLIHNFRWDWITKINFVFWSISVEWQIYFVFALVLLPLWRRLGLAATVGLAVVGPLLFGWLTHHAYQVVHLHFVGLFALGMAAAALEFSEKRPAWVTRAPWGVLTAGACLLYVLLLHRAPRFGWNGNLRLDLAGGAATALLLLWLTRGLQDARPLPRLTRFLQSRPMVILGTFSYSLYLTHAAILAIVTLLLTRYHVPALPFLLVQLGVGVPVSVAVAYGFFWFCERPFLPGRPRTEPERAEAAIVFPAP